MTGSGRGGSTGADAMVTGGAGGFTGGAGGAAGGFAGAGWMGADATTTGGAGGAAVGGSGGTAAGAGGTEGFTAGGSGDTATGADGAGGGLAGAGTVGAGFAGGGSGGAGGAAATATGGSCAGSSGSPSAVTIGGNTSAIASSSSTLRNSAVIGGHIRRFLGPYRSGIPLILIVSRGKSALIPSREWILPFFPCVCVHRRRPSLTVSSLSDPVSILRYRFDTKSAVWLGSKGTHPRSGNHTSFHEWRPCPILSVRMPFRLLTS